MQNLKVLHGQNLKLKREHKANRTTALFGKRGDYMTEQEIKELLSTEILNNIHNVGYAENVLRDIIFNPENKINWQNVYEVIKRERPELRLK